MLGTGSLHGLYSVNHAFGSYPETKCRAVTPRRSGYDLFVDLGEAAETLKGKKTKTSDASPAVGKAMVFLSDHGDEWLFRAELTGLGTKGAKACYPKVRPRQGPHWCSTPTRSVGR
jgi:hypothetical protein